MLTDPKSSRIRGVVKLQKRDARSETGLFLLEGLQGFKEALKEPARIQELFVTQETLGQNRELFDRAEALGIEFTLVDDRVMKTLCDTQSPQGVVAICQQLDVDPTEIFKVNGRLLVLLANIRDPGNAGTVLRVADAAGADGVLLSSNSVDLYNSKVVRSTTGSLFHIPFSLGVDIAETVSRAKDAGYQVFAADGGGVSLENLALDVMVKPTLWIFGNEAWGFEPEVLELADQVVAVPIYGQAESLNLATAASICLYASAIAQNR